MTERDEGLIEGIRETLSRILQKYDRRYYVECGNRDRQPLELVEALHGAGILGVGVPEEMGGVGGGLVEELAVVEAIAGAGIHPGFVLLPSFARKPVMKYGSPEQIAAFVGQTLRPTRRPCFALSEPDAGTNSFRIKTFARQHENGWTVNGQKTYISNAGEADLMLLVARTAPYAPDAPTRGMSLFIVPTSLPGITMNQQRIDAHAPVGQFEIFFDNVELPADALVGEAGGASEYLFTALNPERILAAGSAAGLGEFVLQRGADYARTRAPFGKPIGSYQGIAHAMARAKIQLEAAKVMTRQAAASFDDGASVGILASSAKFIASEAANAALDATIQAHGGSAFDLDVDIISFYQQLRLYRIAPINNEMVLNYVAERALSLPRSY